MGGYVGLTIRFSEDEVHKLEINTNSLIKLKSKFFLEMNPEHVEAIREASKDPDFQYCMAPSEYGLVVADFVTKTIISKNFFTSLDGLTFITEFSIGDTFEEQVCLTESDYLVDLIECGRITSIKYKKEKEFVVEPLTKYGSTTEEILRNIFEKHKRSFSKNDNSEEVEFSYGYFVVEYPGFNLIEFKSKPEDFWKKSDWDEFKNKIQIPFTDEDETKWEEALTRT